MDILIKNMKKPLQGMYEEIRVWDDGRVDIYDCESESYIPTTTAIPVPTPIDYKTEADVLLKLWMDRIITDGEYNRIMERLNKAVVLERTT